VGVVKASDISRKPWNQRLSNGITEHELWPYDQNLDDRVSTQVNMAITPTYFWRESLKERHSTFVTDQVPHDCHAARLLLKVGILDTRFDCVERRCDGDGRNSARYRGDKVLRPCRLAIVRYAKDIVFCNCAGTEQLRHPHSSAKRERHQVVGKSNQPRRSLERYGQPSSPNPDTMSYPPP
jgi:hypothetical protein